MFKAKKRYYKISMWHDMCNAISTNKRCKLQKYGFRNSIEQTVSPCIAHVQGSCFT